MVDFLRGTPAGVPCFQFPIALMRPAAIQVRGCWLFAAYAKMPDAEGLGLAIDLLAPA